MGLLQLGLGFLCLYFGAQYADPDGMVAMYWLLLMYLLLTTGELCLSPVGLSMVTRLSPARLVSTVMGSWFLATAFSQFLAAIVAQFAAVDTGGGKVVPIPAETVNIYGDVYKLVAIMALVSGVVLLALSPILKKWMHQNEPPSE
jgi:POT family proton-dependent oligopeptide transporter